MLDSNKPVRVFYNWKRGCYSVMQAGILRMSVREILLSDVEFIVRESGRSRMLRTGRKNVHAYAQGHLVDCVRANDERSLGVLEGRRGYYDATRADTFLDAHDDSALTSAALVQLDARGLTYAAQPVLVDEPTLAA